VGTAVKCVVEELEADHLRPSGILGRLKQGVDPGVVMWWCGSTRGRQGNGVVVRAAGREALLE
jgi:hypothetical protein